jgi:transposase-like protein
MSKRRAFTPRFKAQVVLEELTGVKNQAEICREHRLRSQVFSHWRKEFLERALAIFAYRICMCALWLLRDTQQREEHLALKLNMKSGGCVSE